MKNYIKPSIKTFELRITENFADVEINWVQDNESVYLPKTSYNFKTDLSSN